MGLFHIHSHNGSQWCQIKAHSHVKPGVESLLETMMDWRLSVFKHLIIPTSKKRDSDKKKRDSDKSILRKKL